MKIVSIKKEDLPKITELYVNVLNAPPWNDKWTFENAYKRLNDIFISPNFKGLLYKEKDHILGAAFGNLEQFYDGIHYNLKEIFIANEIQGKGIGSKLLKELERQLKSNNVTTIILFTSKGNKTHDFYLKNNYAEFSSMIMMGKDL